MTAPADAPAGSSGTNGTVGKVSALAATDSTTNGAGGTRAKPSELNITIGTSNLTSFKSPAARRAFFEAITPRAVSNKTVRSGPMLVKESRFMLPGHPYRERWAALASRKLTIYKEKPTAETPTPKVVKEVSLHGAFAQAIVHHKHKNMVHVRVPPSRFSLPMQCHNTHVSCCCGVFSFTWKMAQSSSSVQCVPG